MPFRYLFMAIRCDVWFTARRSQEPVHGERFFGRANIHAIEPAD